MKIRFVPMFVFALLPMIAETPAPAPSAPTLKIEALNDKEENSILRPQVRLMEATNAMSDLMKKLQQQVESLPEYKDAKAKLDAAQADVNTAAKAILDERKCPNCSIIRDPAAKPGESGRLMLQYPAPAVADNKPPAAK